MFKLIQEARFKISCDWCYEEVTPTDCIVPEGWFGFPAEIFGGLPGHTLHWCPECIEKVRKLRVRDAPIVPADGN